MSTTSGALRLEGFRAKRLFGEFDHDIPLNLVSRITALIAPNGMGKTACLQLINALFRRKWSVFASTEFEKIEFAFNNGSRIVITHATKGEDFSDDNKLIQIETLNPGQEVDVWSPSILEKGLGQASRFEIYLPFLSRIGPSRWIHDHTRQILGSQDIIEQYSDRLPEHVLAGLSIKLSPALSSLVEAIDCHVIETQRLLILPDEDARRGTSTLAIARKAQTLTARFERLRWSA